ncbi:MAG: hypothetical protein IKH14_02055 [Prevotella sp.]|nr:hypothetical protein [Prevotella sp.]
MKTNIAYDNDKAVSILTIGYQVDEILELLSKIYNDKDKWKVIFDLYKRIKFNIAAIAMLDNKNWATTPQNNLYRSVITDMMYVMYHILASDEESSYCIEFDNYKHVKSAYQFLKSHCKFAKELFNQMEQPIDKTEKELLDRYKKHFSYYIRDNNGEWEFVKPNNLYNSSYNGTIQSVANYLESNESNIYFISYLYMCYKELSQTEHYSVKGKLFAFYTSDSFNKFHKIILHGIMCITNQYVIMALQE